MIFECKEDQVGELLEEGEFLIRCEKSYLDDLKKCFYLELNVYVDIDVLTKVGAYNNLLLGLEIVTLLQRSILINDESNDPYQWLLLDKSRRLYLVEEIDNEIESICLKEEYLELSLIKSMKLLPNFSKLNNKDIVYFVDSPSLWREVQIVK
ncbi:hypothetical protein HN014_04560 [Aquimarina sp. TRL1]|uniref:hypothetical protein n=1 Tax=Aquimarina sp. (strain TRL1) TaxID=2736252 RepID=UPI00158D314D|nr:hypothetical protein [Aquimarina sp. TRL1]QKX04210.1 hypothetical protein HN014_04560 [Aquimarina sp. TRL1]